MCIWWNESFQPQRPLKSIPTIPFESNTKPASTSPQSHQYQNIKKYWKFKTFFLFLYKFLIPSKSIFGFEHFRLTARGRGIDESAWKWGFWENEVSYLQQILSHFSRLNILTFKWSKSWVISKLNGPKEWKWSVIIHESYKIYMIHSVYIKMVALSWWRF